MPLDVVKVADTKPDNDLVVKQGTFAGSSQESIANKHRRILQAAIIEADTKGSTKAMDLYLKHARGISPTLSYKTGKQILLDAADEQRIERTRSTLELLLQLGAEGENPEIIEEAITTVQQEDAEEAQQEDRGTRRFLGALSHEIISPEIREDLEVSLELLDQLSEISDDIGGLEFTTSLLLTAVIGPKVLKDNWDLLGEANVFEHEQIIRKLMAWFQQLPPKEKKQWFPHMQKIAFDAMSRPRAVTFLTALLDPTAEDDVLAEFGFWSTAFSVADSALIVGGIASVVIKLRKALNPLRVAVREGNLSTAADMNMSLLQSTDKTLGEAIQVDRLTQVNNALPFDTKGMDDAANATMSPAVAERIYEFDAKVERVIGGIAREETFLREGIVGLDDLPTAMARLDAEYKAVLMARFKGQEKIVNLRSTGKKETSRGVEFEFEWTNIEGDVVKDTYKGWFKLSDVTKAWETLPGNGLFASSKVQSAKTDFLSTTNAGLRVDLTAANLSEQLRKLVKEASKPIRRRKGARFGRKARIRAVDDILIHGDDVKTEFTPEQLKGGFANGIRLDEHQIEYYYNMRSLMNQLGEMRNVDTRNSWVAQGVKEVGLMGGLRTFATPIDTFEEAQRATSGAKGAVVKVFKVEGDASETSHAIDVAKLDLEAEYAAGFKLVKTRGRTKLNEEFYDLVLVKSDEIGELPSQILHWQKGYITRVNPKAVYFVQMFTDIHINGVRSSSRKALRSFDTKADALDFKNDLTANPRQFGYDTRARFEVNTDKELEAFKAGDSKLGGHAGLIHSPRAREAIPHNEGDVLTSPRMSALSSIELYLQNTVSYLARNEWRMGMRKKWEITAEAKLGSNTRDIDFDNPGKALDNADLRVAHEKILEYSGFTAASERRWEQFVRNSHEWTVHNFGRSGFTDLIINQRNKDPLATIRAVTFHNLLGVFNPIQLWVQAQGAAIALAVGFTNPLRLQKVFRQMHGLALIQHLGVDQLNPSMWKSIAKLSGFKSVDELKTMKKVWDKSGLYQSVLSSSDVEAAARGFPMTAGGVKRFFDSGLMFFRTGELFNRRMGFLTAVDELGGAAAVVNSLSNTRKVMDRTNDIILNLGKANRAFWQKGLLSIPTQFLQIQAKTMESILGLNGAFTGLERTMILLTQLGLYGSAGVFGGNWVANNILSATGMTRLEIDQLEEWKIRAIGGGLTDVILYHMGANVLGADRGALLNGMDRTIISLLTEEITPFKLLTGPSSVLPTRFANALHQMTPWMAVPQDVSGQTDLTGQDVADVLLRIGENISDVALSPLSSTTQYNRYRMMTDLHQLIDRNNNVIYAPPGGFKWQTRWATLIGFKPEILQRKHDLSEMVQAKRDYVAFRSNMLMAGHDKWLMDWQRAKDSGTQLTDEELRVHEVNRQVLIDSLLPGMRAEVMSNFQKRLRDRGKPGASQHERLMRSFMDNLNIDLTDSMLDDLRGAGAVSDSTRVIKLRLDETEQ